jgi:hypothetical protein
LLKIPQHRLGFVDVCLFVICCAWVTFLFYHLFDIQAVEEERSKELTKEKEIWRRVIAYEEVVHT